MEGIAEFFASGRNRLLLIGGGLIGVALLVRHHAGAMADTSALSPTNSTTDTGGPTAPQAPAGNSSTGGVTPGNPPGSAGEPAGGPLMAIPFDAFFTNIHDGIPSGLVVHSVSGDGGSSGSPLPPPVRPHRRFLIGNNRYNGPGGGPL